MVCLILSRRSNAELGIRRRYEALITVAFVILGTPLASTHLAAQWLKYPTAGVPRKADGKVDMSAPSPRMADGKPDFSGIWTTGEPYDRRSRWLVESQGFARSQGSASRTPHRLLATPLQSLARARWRISVSIFREGCLINPGLCRIVKERTDNLAKDDPHIRCLPDNFLRAYGMPHLLKFVHTPESFGGAQ